MAQLRLIQQAQQLEEQRLMLVQQQRDLEAQAQQQQVAQNEILRIQQKQQQQFQLQQQVQQQQAVHAAQAVQVAQAEAQVKALQIQQQQAHQQQIQQQVHSQQGQSALAQQQQAQLQIQEAQRQQAQLQNQAADELRRAAALQQQRERDRELNVKAQQQAQQQSAVKKDEIYPVIFHWSHGGKEVYVAYSGDNWGQKYRMQRSHGDFSLIMEIEPGVYHYKFIVDNQWRCAPDQKYVRDANGAYSNVLDVRSHSYQQVIEEQKKKRQREREKDKYQYTQNLPKSDHYVQDPPLCPIHLHKVILNNEEEGDGEEDVDVDGTTKRKRLRGKKNVNTMDLPKPLRVSLNHLYVSDKREEEVVTLGMTERYKDKFFTTVYYTPIESRGKLESMFKVSTDYFRG